MFRRLRHKRRSEGEEVFSAAPPTDTGSSSRQDPEVVSLRSGRPALGIRTLSKTETYSDQVGRRSDDPFGLQLLYEPSHPQKADIIFIHGLGGGSRRTWTKNMDPSLFWPQEWLPDEAHVCDARLWTFGYNSQYLAGKGKYTILNITDFARDLLFAMKFGSEGEKINAKIGQTPIIFVAHSMGGLVVKKALILSQNDVEYVDIARATRAILFLSTPHRGSEFAEVLNRVLAVSVRRYAPKQYIAELTSGSPAIQSINEQFRNLTGSLDIFSFYETFETAIGLTTVMVLQKESSTLGYPGEVAKPMNADHRQVCKFLSRDDDGYISIRGVLQELLQRYSEPGQEQDSGMKELAQLQNFLGVVHDPADDFEFFLSQKLEGSCEWALQNDLIRDWISDESAGSRILWCTGRPGAGKSVFAASLIDHLEEQNVSCSYFFFRHDEPWKRSVAGCLKSVAHQIATQVPGYRQHLLRLLQNGLNVQDVSSRVIWQKLFTNILLKHNDGTPLFLVVDGLDESEQPASIIRLFGDLRLSEVSIRVLFISRPTQALSSAFGRVRGLVRLDSLPLDSNGDDLRRYLREEMSTMRGEPSFKAHVGKRILKKSEGSFLWVALVLEEILQCHTEEAVEAALDEVPADLKQLYRRMDASLANGQKPRDLAMARMIFTWVTCARRTLTLEELSKALQPEYSNVLDLELTISQLCGNFVVVSNKAISMVHLTARECLTTSTDLEFSISPARAHHFIFKKCLSALRVASLRSQTDKVLTNPFLRYASTSWPYHLERHFSEEAVLLLSEFFQESSVLTWIYLLSVAGELRIMIRAARVLREFLNESNRRDAEQNPLTHQLREKDILSAWTVDLTKIVAKFGIHLTRYPKAVFGIVPAFCPPKSRIYSQFVPKVLSTVPDVAGLYHDDWDDCLVRFPVVTDSQPMKIMRASRYLAVLNMDASIIFYDAQTYEIAKTIRPNAHVLAMCFNPDGDKMVTCSLPNTTLWSTATGQAVGSIKNPKGAKALAVSFLSDRDESIIVCFDNCDFRWVSFDGPEKVWQPYPNVMREDSHEFQRRNSPRVLDFSPDGAQIAVGYRGLPLFVWAVHEPRPRLLGKCEREGDKGKNRQGLLGGYTDVQSICWNPITGHVIGTFNDGCVFKWQPLDGTLQTSKTLAVHLACSPDGNFFVTGNSEGNLKIWDFKTFSVICRISCATPLTSLAIGQGTRRIHDIRDKLCSVWEPNALIRLGEEEDGNSDRVSSPDSSTLVSNTSESSAEAYEPITALAVDNVTQYHCTGDQDGVLKLFTGDGRQVLKTPGDFLAIEQISWSGDGTFLATAGLARRITAYRFDPAGMAEPLEEVLEVKEDVAVRQLLWSPENDFILASTKTGTSVWQVKSRNKVFSETGASYVWFNHPFEAGSVVGFAHDHVRTCQWASMDAGVRRKFNPSLIENMQDSAAEQQSEIVPCLKKVSMIADAADALLEISADRRTLGNKRFFLLSMTDLFSNAPQSAGGNTTLALKPLHNSRFPRIELPFGFLPNEASRKSRAQQRLMRTATKEVRPTSPVTNGNSTLAFLDHEFWVCTWTWIGNDIFNGHVRRHFFLPREWLNMECLKLATLRDDGALLCPKNGEVALISNGFENEWIE